jgi:acetyl esterase/lipase
MQNPTLENVRYGPHARNVLDLWRPAGEAPVPVYVFIHGGGFRNGDKREKLPEPLRDQLLEAGIAMAAINYRLSDVASYPAAMEDSARALQYIRWRAADWGLDKTRVAAGGGSAGSGITFWIGFGPDRADPASPDPVARESTRLTAIASWQAQCSYDPHFVRTIISGDCYRHEAIVTFFRMAPDEFDTPEARRVFREVDFVQHATADAPPVLLWYTTPNLPMTPDLGPGPGIHHPKHGFVVCERLTELGVPCRVLTREDRPELDGEDLRRWFFAQQVGFLKRHLL